METISLVMISSALCSLCINFRRVLLSMERPRLEPWADGAVKFGEEKLVGSSRRCALGVDGSALAGSFAKGTTCSRPTLARSSGLSVKLVANSFSLAMRNLRWRQRSG